MADPVAKPPVTRMASRLAPKAKPQTLAERLADAQKQFLAGGTTSPKREITIPSRAPIDDQFHGHVEHSPAYGPDAGRTWAPQIVITPTNILHASPEGDKDWFWRINQEQDRVDPRLQGWGLLWVPPPGWYFIDDVGSETWDEDISNPCQITRVVHSPHDPNNEIGFYIDILKKYLP